MPTKKPDNDTPRTADTVARDAPMDPEVEARRSGPPAGETDRPDRELGPTVHGTDPQVSAMIAIVDEMLKDPDFDPSGRYRERLAAWTRGRPAAGVSHS